MCMSCHGLQLILLPATNPRRTAVSRDLDNKDFTDHLERELAQHFALAALQVKQL